MDILEQIDNTIQEIETIIGENAYVVVKPNGDRFVYTSDKNDNSLNSLKRSFPGLEITNKSNAVPSYVWSDPKSHGWDIKSIRGNN